MKVTNYEDFAERMSAIDEPINGLMARIFRAMFLYADIYPETVNHELDLDEMAYLAQWVAATILAKRDEKVDIEFMRDLVDSLKRHPTLENVDPCELCGSSDRYHISSECSGLEDEPHKDR